MLGLRTNLAAVVAGLALSASAGCVRVELDSLDSEAGTKEAVRISPSDAVVLCPLSAAATADGVSVVWAGYPPADDRLQLMHVKLSSDGSVLQAPAPVALLDQELTAIQAHAVGAELRVHAIESGASELVALDLSAEGELLNAEALSLDVESVTDRCEAQVQTTDGTLRVYRGQVDGELPLFAELVP